MSNKEKIKLTHYSHGGGWACKIGPDDLSQVLSKIEKPKFGNIIVGFEQSDDAAVIDIGNEKLLVQTVDFFSPIVDDPFEFGKIAAANSLSDIYAMGAKPLFALNIVGFPINDLPKDVLIEILRGGNEIANSAEISIIGGHTVDDAEPKYGLVVSGEVKKENLIKNSGAQPGDTILLTKPIGTGILSSASKKGIITAGEFNVAKLSMMELNKEVGNSMKRFNVNAATDVTGYGLLGHLYEMCKSSQVSAEIYYDKVPFFEKVNYSSQNGAIPGGTKRNLKFFSNYIHFSSILKEHQKLMLADAQTSGGLLIAIPQKNVKEFIAHCKNASINIIGKFNPKKEFFIQVK